MSAQQPGNDWDPIDWRALEPSGAKSPTLNDEMMPASWRDWVKATTAGVNAPVGFALRYLVVSAPEAIGNPYEEWLGRASARLLELALSSAESRRAISPRSHARLLRRPPNETAEVLGIVFPGRPARLSDRPTLHGDREGARAGKRPAGRCVPAGQGQFDDDDRGLPGRSS
jgi:hypothetical protein